MVSEKCCPVCAVVFTRREGESRENWYARKTCTHACAKESRRRNVTRVVLVQPEQRFSWLVTIKQVEPGHRGVTRWLVLCDCGVEKVVGQAGLRNESVKSCGRCSQRGPKPWTRGENHYAWKGDEANSVTKRQRADNAREWGPCQKCGRRGTDRHHKDGDPGNNVPGNLEVLCRRCHMSEDGRLDRFKEAGARHLANLRERVLPSCVNCGDPVRNGGHGRCHTCHFYRWRTGADRTAEMVARAKERRLTSRGLRVLERVEG